MIHSFVVLAQEVAEEHHTPTAFYILGTLLAVFAVVVSALGISRAASFPPSRGARSGVIALAALFVVGACASAVLSA